MHPLRIPLAFALVLTALATRLFAQPITPQHGTRVFVSAREVRVIFPPDSADTLGWPHGISTTNGLRYHWGVLIKGIDGPRRLALDLRHSDSTARTFATLAHLVAAATPGLCTSGVFYSCSPTATGATADGNRVVLTFDQPSIIRRLFGLRPDSVAVTHSSPNDQYRGMNVVVEYLHPQIPTPDSAFLAEAAQATRHDEGSIRSVRRHIAGGAGPGPEIRIAVGDSVLVGLMETTCVSDVCTGTAVPLPTDIWSVDDTAVVGVSFVIPANFTRGGDLADSDFPRAYLVARAPGRTKVRVGRPTTRADSTAYREPPARALERDVVVTARPGREKR